MKVALLHDHLYQAGGAERVLFALARMFPDAPIYTVVYNREQIRGFESCDIRTSFIQKLPLGDTQFKWYLPLLPAAIEELDLSGYDVVISSASGLIKGALTQANTLHICYCHTPTRYLWSDTHRYRKELRLPIIKQLLPLLLNRLRNWDQLAAQRVDRYIANSYFVAQRIRNYYRRESEVIYPPVDTHEYTIAPRVGNYFLVVSRLRPYKKVDLVIRAFNKLHLPLKIAGIGEEESYLRSIARPNIEFLGAVSESEKRKLMSECLAFIHPQEEDFGITAIEAMSAGRPVIAYGAGGALETVRQGETGLLFPEQTWESLVDTIIHFKSEAFNPHHIRSHAEQFGVDAFARRMRELVDRWYAEYRTTNTSRT